MNEQKTVLLVEDDERIMVANRRALMSAGYRILEAENLAFARALLAANVPDAIVLDILLPDGNGLEFIRELRRFTAAPVLLVTALDKKDERLAGLRAGGDDYITKPYDLDELRERVAAFIRRGEMYERRVPEKFSLGPLTLDMVAMRAMLSGVDLQLTPKEYALLLILARNEGKPLPKEILYEAAWNAPMLGDGAALWRQISSLKRKLGECAVEITTGRREGYMLKIIP
ncbi:MAG: response regulator transcription factor [Gracilibacteraceae bacterium]|jgi:DNA-binding response OmpR family regulator|nr:response regulator transcription factor [Gracilibacteraceae bacterium]